MADSAYYYPEWAQADCCNGIAPDFIAILDAHTPDTERLKAAWLISRNIGKDEAARSIYIVWANQNPDKQIPEKQLK